MWAMCRWSYASDCYCLFLFFCIGILWFSLRIPAFFWGDFFFCRPVGTLFGFAAVYSIYGKRVLETSRNPNHFRQIFGCSQGVLDPKKTLFWTFNKLVVLQDTSWYAISHVISEFYGRDSCYPMTCWCYDLSGKLTKWHSDDLQRRNGMVTTRIVPDEPIIDVIGASQYHLRVITLAGEVVFEKAISELRTLGLEEIVDNVSRRMGVLPYRLSLLCLFLVDSQLSDFFLKKHCFSWRPWHNSGENCSDLSGGRPQMAGLVRESPKMPLIHLTGQKL